MIENKKERSSMSFKLSKEMREKINVYMKDKPELKLSEFIRNCIEDKLK